jgi:DNA-binding transcriptional regulator YiaG
MQTTVSPGTAQGLDRIGYPRLSAVTATPFEVAAKEVQVRIGAAIRRRRRAVEVTLLQLARYCGVSFQQVQKYESGACSISAAQLWTMAQALEVPINYFYEAAADPKALARAEAA